MQRSVVVTHCLRSLLQRKDFPRGSPISVDSRLAGDIKNGLDSGIGTPEEREGRPKDACEHAKYACCLSSALGHGGCGGDTHFFPFATTLHLNALLLPGLSSRR